MSMFGPATALLVVDVQNDFTDPSGSLYVNGGTDALAFINATIADAVSAGSTIVYSQDWHPESTPHFAKDGGIWPDHCVADSWGAAFHPDLTVEGVTIHKGVDGEDGYSAFSTRDPQTGATGDTGLAAILETAGVTEAVVVGIATDYCVKETALDAVRLGYRTHLLADGVRAVNLAAGDAARAVAEMVRAGVEVD